MINKKTIFILAIATLVVFGGLGVIIIPYVRKMDFADFFSGAEKYWLQITVGILFGIITAKAGWQIVELPMLKKTKAFFSGLIKPLNLDTTQIVLISLCAGIGEELFFRGAIQPMLGVWMTAILFVLLHGYLNPFDMSLTMYGIYMVLVIGVLGLMTEHFGILTAIVAHTLIDIILLRELSLVQLPDDQNEKNIL